MTLTLDEITNGATARLGFVHRTVLRANRLKPVDVVRTALCEMTIGDVLKGREGFTTALQDRVRLRYSSGRGYGVIGPILAALLLAALCALVECAIRWLWDRFVVKGAGLSAADECEAMAKIVPELVVLGRT